MAGFQGGYNPFGPQARFRGGYEPYAQPGGMGGPDVMAAQAAKQKVMGAGVGGMTAAAAPIIAQMLQRKEPDVPSTPAPAANYFAPAAQAPQVSGRYGRGFWQPADDSWAYRGMH